MTEVQIEIINIVSDLSHLSTKASLANIQRVSMYPTQVESTLKCLEKSGHLTSDNGIYATTEKSYGE